MRDFLLVRNGVLTLYGYGISVRVDRGHLVLEDGIGKRRVRRFPKVGHGIRRVVVIGTDGAISLSALRWLTDQRAAFVMLERDGTVVASTGPAGGGDARLRRAQSLAIHSGLALEIARELITRKLAGQERVIRELLVQPVVADVIASNRESLKLAKTLPLVRQFESQAANAYWFAWRNVAVQFPMRDRSRVPMHWRTFGTRKSSISGSQRLAVNPLNAMLNYMYAILESESRLALAALGLDPAIGFLHMDAPARDSLACDLMEAVRPEIDAYLFDWVSREPLRRNWFFEESDGNCRLMGSFAVKLSETSVTWARAVAPAAEWVARKLWSTLRKPAQQKFPATRLTQSRRREAKGGVAKIDVKSVPQISRICRTCGADLKLGKQYCAACSVSVSRKNLLEIAKSGRVATHSPAAEMLRSKTQNRQREALRVWNPSEKPSWLTEEFYRTRIFPELPRIQVPKISSALRVSKPYATEIRKGRLPHPRHWLPLATLIGLSQE